MEFGTVMAKPEKVRIGDLLVQDKVISQEQLRQALEAQKRSGRRLGRVLVDSAIVTEDQISQALSRQLNIPFVNLKQFSFNVTVARRLPEVQARRFRALVLDERPRTYLVALADPTDLFAYDEISRILKREIEIAVVNESLLLESFDRVYRRTEEITSLARELGEDLGEVVDFGAISAGAEDAPVVKLLQSVFEDAVQVGASDVHIEPMEDMLQIRFRIDGNLQLQTEADKKISSALVQRVKLTAGLDISEKRLPQDGRFDIKARGERIDVRISTMPTQQGESIAMRLLRRAAGVQQLDKLGMPDHMLKRFRGITQRVSGMVLVTGPTGSGKTTTLYAALNEINTVEKKIITVEDPIEYRLRGLNQVQVNEKVDLTFSRVLRSALRHDPDVILIGEMRDSETAQIGLRAAITGHMVLSTLHTRDAATTPVRLVDMGAPAYMVASSLHAVIAQRLIRVVCDSCAEPYIPTVQERHWLSVSGFAEGTPLQLKQGRGCQRCNGTGFRGRTGVFEMLEMDATLVDMIGRDDLSGFAHEAGQRMAGKSLRHSAATMVVEGRGSVAEAMRYGAEADD
jgi:MSHA biogenesis protein MshE